MTVGPSSRDYLAGGGDMGALMRAMDWRQTPFGPVDDWPQSLRTAISIMLESQFAMVVAWGPEFRFFYNDRYRPILGTKHPAALGTPGSVIFPEVWNVVGPEFERVRRGEAFAVDDWLLPLERNGYLENCWFTLSYSPIRDETGGVGGLLAVVVETTGRVEGERRLATLRDLARRAADAETPEQACLNAADVFAANPIDVPFALLYLLEEEGTVARRVCTVGIPSDHPASAETIHLASEPEDGWRLAEAVEIGKPIVRSDLPTRFGPLPGGPYEEPTHTAVLLPLSRPGAEHPYGVLVAGVSPRRALDDRYRDFFELAADHIATGISNARAFDEARRRAEALAEIDRAKTAFFSNISHEFRTPLTLMLGPAEDLLAGAHGPLTDSQRAQVDILHRNAGRLLKLVNALLDFSRMEAGRARASYAETDVAALTRELAAAFRAAIEHAGLRFDVDCGPITEPVYVDRDMWEKIVLNLLSNAFKFTFDGSIAVHLRQVDHAIELVIRDTGVGIPESELPRVFERFHRVEGAQSRTHEGSGIGLALTSDLVRLHRGTITADSRVGAGSTFVVRIPTGRVHLPDDRIVASPAQAPATTAAKPYVDEALRWLPAAAAGVAEPLASDFPAASAGEAAPGRRERILVADDNADMREYLEQLLRDWEVTTVADGEAALHAARENPPDLVVTDVMMPGLDGFALLDALREDPRTQAIPVLMLSARAGEEARISGLGAGADDYVTKPFSARELTARVRSLLSLSRARREAELQKQHLHALFMQAPTPIAILRGKDHVVELANPASCHLWGRSEAEILGRPLFEVLTGLRDQPFKQLLDQVLKTGVTYVGKETPARLDRRGDGAFDTVYFNFVYAPLRGLDGDTEGILVLAFDVTDEKIAREQMGELRAIAEGANQAKDEFLATLSHELRTPINAIMGWGQMLQRGAVGPDRTAHALDAIVRNATAQARLIEDLLDLSRITSGKFRLDIEVVDLAAVVAAATATVEPAAQAKGVRLQTIVDDGGGRVYGDRQRLQQAVWNLLSNAVKFTPRGGHVQLHVLRVNSHIEIVISDTGQGIPADVLPYIFDRFRQGSVGSTRQHAGLGLGLAIVRHVIELHGGTIEAASDGPETGATFRIRLPLSVMKTMPGAGNDSRIDTHPAVPAITAATLDFHDLPDLSGTSVLVVEDEEDAREMVAYLLRQKNAEAIVASSVDEALGVIERRRPHVILSDVEMPGRDGYDLIRAVRSRPAEAGGTIPAAALTAYSRPEDRAKSLLAGFDAHLSKPVDLAELVATVARLRGNRAHPIGAT